MRRQDADQRERNRQHDRQRRDERLEPADDQDVDQHQHRRERDAEIAEHLVGDVPLAVPLHRVLRAVERLMRVEDLERRSLRAAGPTTARGSSAGSRRRDSRLRRRRRRSRRSPAAGSCDRRSAPRARARLASARRRRPAAGPEPQRSHRVERSAQRARQPQHDRHVLARAADRAAGPPARRRRPSGRPTRPSALDTPAAAAFSSSTSSRHFGCGDSTYQSTSTTPCGVLERRRAPSRASSSRALGIGPVDLGDERLQHRRTRRHLHDLDPRAEPRRDRVEPRRGSAWRSRGSARARSSLPTSITCRSARFGSRRRK